MHFEKTLLEENERSGFRRERLGVRGGECRKKHENKVLWQALAGGGGGRGAVPSFSVREPKGKALWVASIFFTPSWGVA